MKYILIFTFLLLFSSFVSSSAQEDHLTCGFRTTQADIDSSRAIRAQIQKFTERFEAYQKNTAVVQIPIKVHIVRRTDGSGGLQPNVLSLAIDRLNRAYAPANLQFFQCGDISYINNSQLLQFEEDKEDQLVSLSFVPRKINIYFTESIKDDEGNGLNGYAYLPWSGRDVILMTNERANTSTIEHEMGHYFGLFHTHGKSNFGTTDELVDGSNCDVAGDEICDTPADPNLLGKVDAFCNYTGNAQDERGTLFMPDPRNVMSYSVSYCRDKITTGQYARVAYFYQFYRFHLSCNSNDEFLDLRMYSEYTIEPEPIIRNQFFQIFFDLANFGRPNFRGKVRLALHEPDPPYSYIRDINIINTDIEGGYYKPLTFSGNLDVPAGKYLLTGTYSPEGITEWFPIRSSPNNDYYSDIFINVENQGSPLTVAPTAIAFEASGGNKTINVSANAPWTVNESLNWISVVPASGNNNGTFRIIAQANNSTFPRSGIITVTSGGSNRTINITQAAATSSGTISLNLNSAITITPNPVVRTQPVEVKFTLRNTGTANFTGSVSIDLLKEEGGSGSSYIRELSVKDNINICSNCNSVTLTYSTILDDIAGNYRIGVYFLPAGSTDWMLVGSGSFQNPQVFSLTNTSSPSLNISPSALGFEATGGTQSIAVTSNSNWIVSTNQSWLSVNPNNGTNNSSVSVICATNNNTTARNGTITISGGGISRTITVTQQGAGAVLNIASTSIEASTESGSQSIAVVANVPWTASESLPWVSINPSNGNGNGLFIVRYEANTSSSPRSGDIQVSGGGITRVLNITQQGILPELNISTTAVDFERAGGDKTINISSNINWIITSDQAWVSASPVGGSGNSSVQIRCNANQNITSRMAVITVAGGGLNKTVNIMQAGETAFSVSPAALVFDAAGGNQKVKINTASNWLVNTDQPWIAVNPIGGTGTNELALNCQPNTSSVPRIATVQINSGGSNRIISISQQGVATNLVTIASAGEMDLTGTAPSLEWTIGEAIIPTIGSNLILTQGFHQTFASDLTSLQQTLFEDVFLEIFPNPVYDILNITVRSQSDQEIALTLISVDGKILTTKLFSGQEIMQQLDMRMFPAGIYMITLQDKIRQWQTAQKIIKTK